ncbi:MAG: hypothetical protein KJ757_05355, partial [Planctomycetes bacterium]|nr:hypothetical protein [Planctomycetota bacterium]
AQATRGQSQEISSAIALKQVILLRTGEQVNRRDTNLKTTYKNIVCHCERSEAMTFLEIL